MPPGQKPGNAIALFLSLAPHRATEGQHHISETPSICSQVPHPGDYLRLHPIHFKGVLFYIRPCYQDRESKQLYPTHRNKHREAAKARRQRNMDQMKEQIKSPEKELNEMEKSNLSDAEFKTLFIRMLEELSGDLSSIKKISQKQRIH